MYTNICEARGINASINVVLQTYLQMHLQMRLQMHVRPEAHMHLQPRLQVHPANTSASASTNNVLQTCLANRSASAKKTTNI